MWEYDWVDVKDEDYDKPLDKLNEAGKLGWEFTGYTRDTGHGIEYLMKRNI